MVKRTNETLTIQIPCSIIKRALESGEKSLKISLDLELEKLSLEHYEAKDFDQELSGIAALSLRFA